LPSVRFNFDFNLCIILKRSAKSKKFGTFLRVLDLVYLFFPTFGRKMVHYNARPPNAVAEFCGCLNPASKPAKWKQIMAQLPVKLNY